MIRKKERETEELCLKTNSSSTKDASENIQQVSVEDAVTCSTFMLYHAPVIELITDLLSQTVEPVEYINLYLRLLISYSRFAENFPTFVHQRTSAIVIGCMSAHIQHPAVQEMGAEFLRQLTELMAECGTCKCVIGESAVELIVASLRRHSSDRRTVRSGVQSLSGIARALTRIVTTQHEKQSANGGNDQSTNGLNTVLNPAKSSPNDTHSFLENCTAVLNFISDVAYPVVLELRTMYAGDHVVHVQSGHLMEIFASRDDRAFSYPGNNSVSLPSPVETECNMAVDGIDTSVEVISEFVTTPINVAMSNCENVIALSFPTEQSDSEIDENVSFHIDEMSLRGYRIEEEDIISDEELPTDNDNVTLKKDLTVSSSKLNVGACSRNEKSNFESLQRTDGARKRRAGVGRNNSESDVQKRNRFGQGLRRRFTSVPNLLKTKVQQTTTLSAKPRIITNPLYSIGVRHCQSSMDLNTLSHARPGLKTSLFPDTINELDTEAEEYNAEWSQVDWYNKKCLSVVDLRSVELDSVENIKVKNAEAVKLLQNDNVSYVPVSSKLQRDNAVDDFSQNEKYTVGSMRINDEAFDEISLSVASTAATTPLSTYKASGARKVGIAGAVRHYMHSFGKRHPNITVNGSNQHENRVEPESSENNLSSTSGRPDEKDVVMNQILSQTNASGGISFENVMDQRNDSSITVSRSSSSTGKSSSSSSARTFSNILSKSRSFISSKKIGGSKQNNGESFIQFSQTLDNNTISAQSKTSAKKSKYLDIHNTGTTDAIPFSGSVEPVTRTYSSKVVDAEACKRSFRKGKLALEALFKIQSPPHESSKGITPPN